VAPHVTPIERLEEQPISVDPRAIEDEFNAIWRQSAGSALDESSARIRVLNFAGVAGSDEEARRFDAAVETVAQRHPCRSILALLRGGEQELQARLSARCWRSGALTRHVCSEEVLLTSGAEQQKQMASLVRAVLVPELPTALWMLEPPPSESDIVQSLMTQADRLIFDTDASTNAAAAYAWLLEVDEDEDLVLGDLAWARTNPWRELTAQFFDGNDGARELQQIASVQVVGGTDRVSSGAMLHAAWLISRLGLAIADASANRRELHATLYRGSRGVHVSAVPGVQGRSIERVRIVTADAEFVIECHEQSNHLHVREQWEGGATRRVVEQPTDDEGAIVTRALDGVDDGPLYEEALRTASTMMSS
jgi:glucose-6-phosphate dehydrogenase assembly protein OpcA